MTKMGMQIFLQKNFGWWRVIEDLRKSKITIITGGPFGVHLANCIEEGRTVGTLIQIQTLSRPATWFLKNGVWKVIR